MGIGINAQGIYSYANVSYFEFITDSSKFAFFYRIKLIPNPVYLDINVDKTPVNTPVSQLGIKYCIVSPNANEVYNVNRENRTMSIDSFREECLAQYTVFSMSYAIGANSITPAIVHCEVLSNADSIATLGFLNANTVDRPLTNAPFNGLLQVIRSNPTWRLAYIVMEFIDDSITLYNGIRRSLKPESLQRCAIRPLLLSNMNRWALLISAEMSGLLHQDLHQENALFSHSQTGFFHDRDERGRIVSVPSSIQIIDWGSCMKHPVLIAMIRQLFTDMRAHISKHKDHFLQSVSTSIRNAETTRAIYNAFNVRIHAIFTEWLRVIYRGDYWPFQWVINLDAHRNDMGALTAIDSHAIMFYDRKYRNGKSLVTPDTFKSVVPAQDRQIMLAISSLQ